MSFSSNIKAQLEELANKRDCCCDNLARGRALKAPNGRCTQDPGCYLRGVFLRCGSVSEPKRNFMLTFTLPDEAFTNMLEEFLELQGFPAKRSVRRGRPILYYRASENIEDILSFMGATKAVLDILNTKVMNDVRNSTNRLCNAETANLVRATRAASAQCEAIRTIIAHGALDNLPPELKEAALLRLENPDMSLTQLRELLTLPVSKSGLNHRFKKLTEIAEVLKLNS